MLLGTSWGGGLGCEGDGKGKGRVLKGESLNSGVCNCLRTTVPTKDVTYYPPQGRLYRIKSR